jgi:hypothetical protein
MNIDKEYFGLIMAYLGRNYSPKPVKYIIVVFAFWSMHFLKANEKPTNALIIQCIGTHSPACFGTLKYHHQGVKHDPAEIGSQRRGKEIRMRAVYCNRRCNSRKVSAL